MSRAGYTLCPDGHWRKRVEYADGTIEILIRDSVGRLRVDRESNWPHTYPAKFKYERPSESNS